jgi:hypothetical protein
VQDAVAEPRRVSLAAPRKFNDRGRDNLARASGVGSDAERFANLLDHCGMDEKGPAEGRGSV